MRESAKNWEICQVVTFLRIGLHVVNKCLKIQAGKPEPAFEDMAESEIIFLNTVDFCKQESKAFMEACTEVFRHYANKSVSDAFI